jgi:hypothetical protein
MHGRTTIKIIPDVKWSYVREWSIRKWSWPIPRFCPISFLEGLKVKTNLGVVNLWTTWHQKIKCMLTYTDICCWCSGMQCSITETFLICASSTIDLVICQDNLCVKSFCSMELSYCQLLSLLIQLLLYLIGVEFNFAINSFWPRKLQLLL